MRRAAATSWALTLDEWVKRESSLTGFDTQRLERLIDQAWTAAVAAAAPWDPTFTLMAVRSLPPEAIDVICQIGFDTTMLGEIVRVATAAAASLPADLTWPWWTRARGVWTNPGAAQREVIAAGAATVLGSCLGAASLMCSAQRWYRGAGKGLRIASMPEPMTPQHHETIAQWSGSGLMTLPSVEFAPDGEIERAIALYEHRRDAARTGEDSTRETALTFDAPATVSPCMWGVAWRNAWRYPLPVRLPGFDFTFSSPSWYPAADAHIEEWADELRPFNAMVLAAIGLDADALRSTVHALGEIVEHRTRCAGIAGRMLRGSTGEFLWNPPNATEANARDFGGLLIRGMVAFDAVELHQQLVNELQQVSCNDAENVAQAFITACSGVPEVRGLPNTVLFYRVGDTTLLLDLARWADVKGAITTVTLAHTGEIGNERGRIFEESVRSRLRTQLELGPSDLPWPANRDVIEGSVNLGDVDFCFTRNGILFHLDMKSWRRSSPYHIGHHHTMTDRQKELRMYLERVVHRGAGLQKQLEAEGAGFRGRADFLVVPLPEYVAPDVPLLWYAEQPRIVTVDELVELARGPNGLAAVLSA